MWARQGHFTSALQIYLAIDSNLKSFFLEKISQNYILPKICFESFFISFLFFSFYTLIVSSYDIVSKVPASVVWLLGLVKKFVMCSGKSFFSRNTFTIYKITSLAIWEVLIASKQIENPCVCPDLNGNPQEVSFATSYFVALFWEWSGGKNQKLQYTLVSADV